MIKMYFENEDVIDKYFMDIVIDSNVKCLNDIQLINKQIRDFDRNYTDVNRIYNELISKISLNNITVKTSFNIIYIICEYRKFEKFHRKLHKYITKTQFISKVQEKVYELSLFELFTITKRYQKHNKNNEIKYKNFNFNYEFFENYVDVFIDKYNSNFMNLETFVNEYVDERIKEFNKNNMKNSIKESFQQSINTDSKKEIEAILSKPIKI